MPKLSWIAGPNPAGDTGPDRPTATTESPAGEFLVMASRLELRSFRDFVPFLRASLAIRRQAGTAPGNVGHALAVDIGACRFWTLSTWRGRAELDEFVRQQPHLSIMRRFRPALKDATFAFVPTAGTEMPMSWPDVRGLLAAQEHGRTEQTTQP